MPSISFSQQLTNFIRSSQDQGILDDTVGYLNDVRNHPLFISQIITYYIHEAEETIARITNNLSEPRINYPQLDMTAHLLKGCSSSVGGCRMVVACVDLQRAAEEADREKCITAFEKVKREYETLHNTLNSISEMERAIPWPGNGVGRGRGRGQP